MTHRPRLRPARGLRRCSIVPAPARAAPRIADRICADRVPAGLLPNSAGRSRRGALRASHQADAGNRPICRHPFPGRGPLQEAGRHLLAAGGGGEGGRGGRLPERAHHHLALPAAVAAWRHRRGAADLLGGSHLSRGAPRWWRTDDGELDPAGVEARLATTDAVLLFTCVAAMGAMARIYGPARPDVQSGWRSLRYCGLQ